jgi:hypothetical protein
MKSRTTLQLNKFARTLNLVLALAAICLGLTAGAKAQTANNIAGAPGYTVAGLILDSAGNLYGTSVYGGSSGNCTLGCGAVFEVSPPTTSGGAWTETVLYSFTKGADGGFPAAGLVFDSKGNLYGTTPEGGAGKYGTVFKLSRGVGGIWKETVLHSFFGGTGGFAPQSGLIFDANGNLYGTAMWGNSTDCSHSVPACGLVFRLSPTSGGGWKETVLHYFSGGTGGAWPEASLTLDAAGNLYGISSYGGKYGSGVAFKLSPALSGSWPETVLHAYTGKADGSFPVGSLVFDLAGNLYGATQNGGTGGGVVYRLSPSGAGWKESVLYGFTTTGSGYGPSAGVILDPAGNLWGTTNFGNANVCFLNGCGQVFQLTPSSSGWTLGAVYSTGASQSPSYGGLVHDAAGNIYGTDTDARYTSYGSVFEVTK